MTWYCTTYGTLHSHGGIADGQLGSAHVCYQAMTTGSLTSIVILLGNGKQAPPGTKGNLVTTTKNNGH